MEILGVVFDMDGVLIDSEPVHIESWEILFQERGIDLEGIDYQSAIGMTDEAFLKRLSEQGRLRGDVRFLCLSKQLIYASIHADRFKEQPGARETLLRVASQRPVALATSDWRANALRTLEWMGLREVFSAILCREDVCHCKPDPEIYLTAAAALNLPPAVCLGVEDSPPGVQAVKAAGMMCAALTTSVPASWLSEADWILPGIRDLLEAIPWT